MIKRRSLPSRAHLLALFAYDAETGVLTWLPHSGRKVQHNGRWAGRIAGNRHPLGYLVVRFEGRRHLAHRLIWKLVHDAEPASIDHVNGDGCDNRLSNLRACTHFENMRNARGWSKKELPKGVHLRPKSGRYRAIICVNRRNRSLGTFDTIEDASAAYAAAARKLHGDFARTA